MKKLYILLSILILTSQLIVSSFSNVTFQQVCPMGNPVGVLLGDPGHGAQAGAPKIFDPNYTGFNVLVQTSSGDKKRAYVLANPYNRVPGFYQVIDQVQPLAHKIGQVPNSNSTNGSWAIYLVPFFVDKKNQSIVTDLSTISSSNPAEVWVAMFDGFRSLYLSQKVSYQGAGGGQADDVDFPVGQRWLQVLNGGTWTGNVAMAPQNDSFAISPFTGPLNSMISGAKNPLLNSFPDINNMFNQLGNASASAVTIMLSGIAKKQKENFNTQLPSNWFLSTQLLNQAANLFTSGSLPHPDLKPFSMQGWSEEEKSYMTEHLAPALQALSSAANAVVDQNGLTSSTHFNYASFNGVLIRTIYNNTKSKFTIFQGSGQQFTKIGSLNPGVNNIALYGAANGQGDIVFASDQQGLGTFRISFKTGSDIIALTQSGDTSGGFSYGSSGPNSSDQFLCIQIKKSEMPNGDFPTGTAQEMQEMIARTHCINLSELPNPAYVDLQIEDHMVVSEGDKQITLDQNKIPMFYPSIRDIIPLQTFVLPSLQLPDSMKSKAQLVAWFDFLNMVLGLLRSGYTWFGTPNSMNGYITNSCQTLFVLREQGEKYGNLKPDSSLHLQDPKTYGLSYTTKSAGYILGGLPGTEYLFTADIPSKDHLAKAVLEKQPINVIASSFSTWKSWLAVGIGNKFTVLMDNSGNNMSVATKIKALNKNASIIKVDQIADQSLTQALNNLTEAQWQQGIYLLPFIANKKAYLALFDGSMNVYACITDVEGLSETSPGNVDLIGSGIQGSNKVNYVTSNVNNIINRWDVFGLTIGSVASLKKTFTPVQIATMQTNALKKVEVSVSHKQNISGKKRKKRHKQSKINNASSLAVNNSQTNMADAGDQSSAGGASTTNMQTKTNTSAQLKSDAAEIAQLKAEVARLQSVQS